MVTIDSIYGHDGFMVESDKIADALKKWIRR
jgi:homoserine acetyltransferase